MYFSLFNTLTDAIELLKEAQVQGEHLFMEDDSPLIPGVETREKEQAAG